MAGSERDNTETEIALPLQSRTTEGPEGESLRKHTVHCPRQACSVSLEHCEACPRFVRTAPDGKLWCRADVPAPKTTSALPPSLAESLAATPVRELMTRDVTCLDSELLLQEAAKILESHRLRGAPVVEDQGILIGMLSMTDLVQGHGRDNEANAQDDAVFAEFTHRIGAVVEEVMTTQLTSLTENASVGEAVRLLASAGVHRLPIVDEGGVVVGIFSSEDLLRWLLTKLDRGP